MTHDPLASFLGVSPDAEPHELLGLAPDQCTTVRIESALRERLGRLYQHPEGSSEEAELVRRRLREAAVYLKIPPPRKPWRQWRRHMAARTAAITARARDKASEAAAAIGPTRLTQLDREVLAVLIGCGGWNAASRARLVALAANHGIAPEGLMTVISGLSGYARSRGPRLDLPRVPAVMPKRRAARSAPPAAVQASLAALEWVTPEFRKDDTFSTIKLAVLFAVVTLLFGVLALRLMMATPGGQTVAQTEAQAETAEDPNVPGGLSPRPNRPDAPVRSIAAARFPDVPTFLGNGVPSAAADAADQTPQVLAALDLTARKLTIEDEPSEAVYRDWAWAIEAVSIGWVLVDASTRRAIDEAIDEVFLATEDRPSVSDCLMLEISPPAGRLAEPLDLWRGPWKAGTLARLTRSSRLPPAVVDRARAQMEVALNLRPTQESGDFTDTAVSWLEQVVRQMVQVLEYGENVYDDWELWISAQRELGAGAIPEAVLMNTIAVILATDTDLSHPGPSVNVLGRLLAMLDFRTSPVVRDRFLAYFDEPATISAHDLWVLSSLLATFDWAAWFDDELIAPYDADDLVRRRVRDRIARRWPAVHDHDDRVPGFDGPDLDEDSVIRWAGLCDRITSAPVADQPADNMHQLLAACLLNEAAAAIKVNRLDHAAMVMDRIQHTDSLGGSSSPRPAEDPIPGVQSPPTRPSRSAPGSGITRGTGRGGGARSRSPGSGGVRPGQPIGGDGAWADEYRTLRRNTNAKLRWLRSLRSAAGSDLGPIDASVFVTEVYHGTPEEVRSVAQSIAVDQFGSGPNVVMEMLDQLPTAPRSADVSEVIRRLTGHVLPGPQGETWPIHSRLALVEHLMSLQLREENEVDAVASMIAETLGDRTAIIRGNDPATPRPPVPTGPDLAVERLAEAWWDRVMRAAGATSATGDMPSLQRREELRNRLAEGPIQRFVAGQLTVLDLLAYVAVLEQPMMRGEINDLFERSAEARSACDHVLRQAVYAERAISQVWRLRLTAAPVQVARRGDA